MRAARERQESSTELSMYEYVTVRVMTGYIWGGQGVTILATGTGDGRETGTQRGGPAKFRREGEKKADDLGVREE